MDQDRRPCYAWMMVLIASIGAAAIGTLLDMPLGTRALLVRASWIFGIVLVLTTLPLLIAQSRLAWKDRLGYGIPALFLLSTLYFVYDYYTCTGKFCQFGSIAFGAATIAAAVIFALFYVVSTQTLKRPLSFALSALGIEACLLIGLTLYFSA